MIKLDIGCGIEKRDESYIGVDAFSPDADVKAFMWELPFEDNSVDEIWTTQALEHVSKFAVVPTLVEWHRVLKPGGMMHIEVPDLVWVCLYWLSHQTVGYELDTIFGNQVHEGEYHKTGFNAQILKQYVDFVDGFDIEVLDHIGPNLEQATEEKHNSTIKQRVIRLRATKRPGSVTPTQEPWQLVDESVAE